MNFQILVALSSLCLISGAIATLEENSEKVVAGEDVMIPPESESNPKTAEVPDDSVGSSEAKEESQLLENFKRLEKFGEERIVKQHETDKAWIERYESVFFGSESIDTEELAAILGDLYRSYADTSNSRELKSLVKNVFNLIKMTYNFANNCNNGNFQRYDAFIEKYSRGFGRSIVNYAQYYRSKFLQTCNKAFLDILKLEYASDQSTESEAFSIVDRVLANNPWQTKEPWTMKHGISSLVPGIVDYVSSKLGKKAHKEVQIEVLFGQTIKPVCSSVVDRFTDQDQIVELMRSQKEVRESLDERSKKWLSALRICELIKEDPESLQSKIHSILLAQRRQVKGKGCFGALLRKKS